MEKYYHSVTLDKDKCRGCTNCIKKCPTEAIRVRKGKATIINERCIDCGECIRICPYHAKKAITDPLESIFSYKYRVVIPAPSFYGQFKLDYSRKRILQALKLLGFNEIFEVAKAAEYVTEATKKLMQKKGIKKPLISSACPAVVRLIQVNFPNLIDNIVKLDSPMETAARIAKTHISRRENIPEEDIGVLFITPCAAKATSVKAPFENKKSSVDGVIAMKDIYVRMLNVLNEAEEIEGIPLAGADGVKWAVSGGESGALGNDNYLTVDGINNVSSILEAIENDKLEDVDFIETLACPGGCIGGPLTAENVYVAKKRMNKHIKDAQSIVDKSPQFEPLFEDLVWKLELEYKPVMKLDDDFSVAMRKLEEMEIISDQLPGLDCGACGAPSCRALAEDIVRGHSTITDCIFKLREKVRDLASQMMDLEAKMPPVMDIYKTFEAKIKMNLTLKEFAERIDAKLVNSRGGSSNSSRPELPENIMVNGIYVGDLLSRVMSKASKGNAWVTVHTHLSIVAVAVFAGISCIVIPEGIEVEEATIKKASLEGIPILSTDLTAYEICVRCV